jgi:UDP-GlcNAc:undecaprenyl-phosphate GlcNAc-1-phosphate transferase
MDGAGSTVAAISATGVGVFAIVGGDFVLAALVLALAGACTGFLPFNLARPSRIFLGDGGSMPIGFVLAAAIMSLPFESNIGWVALFAAAPLVALPILDTTLVVVSRKRRGVQVFSGGRDHLTHRIYIKVGSARLVALCLAAAQSGLCLTAVTLSQMDRGWVMVEATAFVLLGVAAIYVLEVPPRRAAVHAGPQSVQAVAVEQSAA